jgi:hypothetical protein
MDMFTLNILKVKAKRHLTILMALRYLAVLTGIIMLFTPVLVDAHGGGGGGGCGGQGVSYNYGSYLNYPVYYQSAGRNGSVLGAYPGYSYYPAYSNSYPVYSTSYSTYPTYSSYPSVLNSVLPSAYSGVYNLNQPYLLGNTLTSSLLGNTGYSYPVGQVTTKDYSVEQSRTTYVPGGEVTTTASQGTSVSTGYSPYTLGAGTWMNLTGVY